MENNLEYRPGPKEVFLNVFSIGALYVSAGAFLALMFQYVNLAFPDPLQDAYWALEGARSGLRWAVASLIVVFPSYLIVMRYLGKSYSIHPEARDMRSRRWLTHFTLFVAGIIILGDLVRLIFNFLEGDLTIRFVLKAVSVLVVALIVGAYYFREVRGGTGRVVRIIPHRAFVAFVIVVVFAGIVGAFFFAGSPKEERERKFDAQRLSDLQSLQWNVVDYWQSKNELPESLEVLRDDLRGVAVRTDPETNESYGYNVLGDLSFELCANFSREDGGGDNGRKYYPELRAVEPIRYGDGLVYENRTTPWAHGAGYVCFERTIDPDFFEQRTN